MIYLLRFVLVISLIIFCKPQLFSQNWNLIHSREVQAEQLLYEKQYELAAKKFDDALNLIPNSAKLSYKVGYAYLHTFNNKHLAIEYLEQAAEGVDIDYSPNYIRETAAPPEVLYFLAKAYQVDNQFEKAKSIYQQFLEYVYPDDPFRAVVEMQIQACDRAPLVLADKMRVRTQRFDPTINTKEPNFNAVFSADENMMAFTTLSRQGYKVFFATKKDGVWGKPKDISNQLQANFLKTSSLSNDGTEMFLVDDFGLYSDIYHSELENGRWSRARKLKKPISRRRSNETHAALSPDGETLFFTSDRRGGFGGLDIYKATRSSKGRWENPENLGEQINTEFNEETPFLSPDGQTLYFSSYGHNSIGGYDVFRANIADNTKPENLGYPINTADDDLFFFPSIKNDAGFISLYDPQGDSPYDIFFIELLPQITLTAKLNIDGEIDETHDSNLLLKIFDTTNGEEIFSITSNIKSDRMNQIIEPGNYRLVASAEGINDFSKEIYIPDDYLNETFPVELILSPIPKEEPLLAQDTEPEVEPEPEPEQPIEIISPDKSDKFEEIIQETSVAEDITIDKIFDSSLFTVQVMALIIPVDIDYFADIPDINVVHGLDGFYRYVVGALKTKEEAMQLRSKLVDEGYDDAFVRTYPKTTGYTVQIMALKNPVEINYFNDVIDIDIKTELGIDGLHRYFVGFYDCPEKAKEVHQHIVASGFNDAFVRSYPIDL